MFDTASDGSELSGEFRMFQRRLRREWPSFGLSLISLLTAGGADAAPVLPTGGKVAAGQATIGSAAGGTLTINQTSPKAIIDWAGFSIGKGETVAYDNGAGATLNRVTGKQVSSVDGLLTGTGSVYLINPNGVITGRSGVVDVGGTFVASTLDIPDSAFLKGGALTFSGPSTAEVINLGSVGSLGGDVALIAATVENRGAVKAPDGTAGLIAGESVLMRDSSLDDGKFAVLLGGASTTVRNGGLVESANAELRAEGGNVYALAGNTAGVVRASGVKSGDGKIWLVADGGTLDVAGILDASAKNGAGGAIETSGATVDLGGALVNTHGGRWTLDPYDLTVDAAAAGSIDASLNAGSNVILKTTANGTSGAGVANAFGEGDINIDSPLGWSSSATLSLQAYRDVNVAADITVAGGGRLSLLAGTGGTGDYDIQTGDSISFTGGATSGAKLAINRQAYRLLYGAAGVQSINNSSASLGNHFALATLINAANASSWTPIGTNGLGDVLNGGQGFTGVFAGLGHTISNLTVSIDANNYAGLFGYSSGTVRDVELVQGRIGGGGYVGALVGLNAQTGLIEQSSVAATVDAATILGGLVGENDGTISQSSATGEVNDAQMGSKVGGLVGLNTGAISQSYTISSVNDGSGLDVGGVVGMNTGSVADSYAAGQVRAVSGSTPSKNIGGLIGYNSGMLTNVVSYGFVGGTGSIDIAGLVGDNQGKISGGYWDLDSGSLAGTPAAMAGVGPDSSSDQTTALSSNGGPDPFQGASYSSFDFNGVWNIVSGQSFPYLRFQFPAAAPQVISGTGLRAPLLDDSANNGVPQLYGYRVDAIVNGKRVGIAEMGGNGFYDILVPAGTISPDGVGVLVNIVGYPTGETFYDGATGSITNLPLYGHFLTLYSGESTVTDIIDALSTTQGNLKGANEFIYTIDQNHILHMIPYPLSLPSGTQFMIVSSAQTLSLDQVPTLGSSIDYMMLQMTTAGGLMTQSAPITASRVSLLGPDATFSLDDAQNTISILGADVNDLTLANSMQLTIASANTIRGVTASTFQLNDNAGVKQSEPLNVGNLLLQSENGRFALTNTMNAVNIVAGYAGNVELIDADPLSIGAINGVSGLTSTTLVLQDQQRIEQTEGITAASLALLGGGGDVLTSSDNRIGEIAGDVGTLKLVNGENLSVGVVDGVYGLTAIAQVDLETVGAGDDLLLVEAVQIGGLLTLKSAGTLKEGASGTITAAALTGGAVGGTTLSGANNIGALQDFRNSGAGDLTIVNGISLNIVGGVSETKPRGAISLTLASGNLAIGQTASLSGGSISLQTAGMAVEASSGQIDTSLLNVTAGTGIDLVGQNDIATIGTRNTDSGPNTINQ